MRKPLILHQGGSDHLERIERYEARAERANELLEPMHGIRYHAMELGILSLVPCRMEEPS